MVKKHKIDFRTSVSSGSQLWAWRLGTSKEAMESARGLLRHLRNELGFRRSMVWLDGKGVRI